MYHNTASRRAAMRRMNQRGYMERRFARKSFRKYGSKSRPTWCTRSAHRVGGKTVVQLRKVAAQRKIRGRSYMNRRQLLRVLGC